jgi:hypothetical protein
VIEGLRNLLVRRKTSLSWLLAALGLGYIAGKGSALALQQLGVLAWKIMLVGVAVAVAHYLRRQVFHYIDLSAVLDQDKTIKDGLIFLGVTIFYGAIILAITQGL